MRKEIKVSFIAILLVFIRGYAISASNLGITFRERRMHSLSAYFVLGQIYFALCRCRSLPFGLMGRPKGHIGTPSVPKVYPFSSGVLVPRGLRSIQDGENGKPGAGIREKI